MDRAGSGKPLTSTDALSWTSNNTERQIRSYWVGTHLQDLVGAFLQVLHLVGDRNDAIIAFAASLLIPVPFLLAMLVLHHTVADEQRFWTHTAICFAVIYATYNVLNYVVQLATVLPAGYTWSFDNQQGTQGPLSLLNQTPHSLFWDVDALGYIFLSLATLAASPIFENHGQARWVRRFFLANGLIIPLFCGTYFWPGYSAPQLMFACHGGSQRPGPCWSWPCSFDESWRASGLRRAEAARLGAGTPTIAGGHHRQPSTSKRREHVITGERRPVERSGGCGHQRCRLVAAP